MITVIKLLFLSFTLIFAITQPKMQDSTSTVIGTVRNVVSEPITV